MTIAVGTDYWLYSRGVCKTKTVSENETSKKNEEVMTHSGLWRTCCLEGNFKGLCKQIDHFPEDADYEADTAEYFLRAVRASSIFPILSVILLFMGGLCIAASEFYKTRHNIILSAGIFFVSAGLSNIIGIIVYISANCWRPLEERLQEEQLLLRLVLLLRGPVLHYSRDGGSAGRPHVHRPAQTAARQRSRHGLPPVLRHHPHPQLPVPLPETQPLQLPLHRAFTLQGCLSRRDQRVQHPPINRDLDVHPEQGPVEGHHHPHRYLQLRQG
uniref:Calcium voltage-gated channel auxiliary subunit gamma 2 n=1 Tax=Anas platyrhynchos TaxID=8839 RepID=A0A8B9QQB1_ANAPL